MEFTPFVCYLIYIIIISIPVELLYLRNQILHGKFSPAFYIIAMFIWFVLVGYMLYLVYKKQEDDRKHAWMLVGGLIGFGILFDIGRYLSI
jgi:peptidoglycan/LPS O-acetylase OafA/YrhL